jgi:Family of unknown function (DUF6131)
MIVLGVVLLFLCWALPQVLPGIEPALLHIGHVLGLILVVVGLILLVVGHFHPIGGRRYWY